MMHRYGIRKLRNMALLPLIGTTKVITPDSTSSIIGGFYADGYAVDLFMLVVGIAFVSVLIIYKLKGKHKA